MKITYVTGNPGKFAHAQLILKDWQLEQQSPDLPEIQGTSDEIVIAKAKSAVQQLKIPLIVEDVSVYCTALKGLPGPYIKDFLVHLGCEGLSELVLKYDDHSAEACCTAAYIEPNSEPILFHGSTQGKIVKPRGDLHFHKYSWNTIFLMDGHSSTFGELNDEQLIKLSPRTIALKKLQAHFSEAS